MAKRKRPGPRTYLGLPVEDAKKPLHIVVSNGDCRLAKKKLRAIPHKEREDIWPECCAVAVSIKRSDPRVVTVRVHRAVIMVVYDNKVVRYRTSFPIRDQLIRLDGPNRNFDPGTYDALPVPPSIIAARGTKHTPTTLKRGDPNSKKRRQKAHDLGRVDFHYNA